MCGNFGLLTLGDAPLDAIPEGSESGGGLFRKPKVETDKLDQSLNESMHEVSRLHSLRPKADQKNTAQSGEKANKENQDETVLISPLSILQSQTSSTEIRGGQAGGYSSFEYKPNNAADGKLIPVPKDTRVRLVARKRHPLAADLATLYAKARSGTLPDTKSTLTVIGHTRFATSSINKVSELHPHEWVPLHEESVWLFNNTSGKLERQDHTVVGLHITHNGDFDAMEAYSQPLVVDELGHWLARVLHTPNSTTGDSPKIAGMMDVLRVQGRWAASFRLAWIRCVLSNANDVCGGQQLDSSASNTFPDGHYWEQWANFVENIWVSHVNNVIVASGPPKFEVRKTKTKYVYKIDERGLKQFINAIIAAMGDPQFARQQTFAPTTGIQYFSQGLNAWPATKMYGFLYYACRGFLRNDCYNAMTELLSRAEGSFGVQVHSTLEPGVVVIASKGQPMSFAFDHRKSVVLFGSEVDALSVPVYTTGQWLRERIDLDSHGEVVRLGVPRALNEGSYKNDTRVRTIVEKVASEDEFDTVGPPGMKRRPSFKGAPPAGPVVVRGNSSTSVMPPLVKAPSADRPMVRPPPKVVAAVGAAPVDDADTLKRKATSCLLLKCGVEIRAYSLVTCSEFNCDELYGRCVSITAAPIPFDPNVDLVALDLSVTPAVLASIDRTWSNGHSVERVSGQSLAENLVDCMKRRLQFNKDTTDLLIGGVEASLWMAEQWAADLRSIFPQLNVVTMSANKLLGLGEHNPGKVFFPGADAVLARRIDEHTCVLLISQSGQTFPTLHAARKMAKFAGDKLWLLTGCFNSKMEQAMVDGYKERNKPYMRNRVFNNYSGSRPAEPSSVAVAATWHTLTRLLMHVVVVTRQLFPAGRLIHPWDYDDHAVTIQLFFRRSRTRLNLWRNRIKGKGAKLVSIAESAGEADEGELTPNDIALMVPEGGGNSPMSSAHGSTRMLPVSVSLTNSSGSSKKNRKSSSQTYKINNHLNSRVIMNLTDGCIEDMTALLTQTIVPQISQIVGFDVFGNPINLDEQGEKIKQDFSPHAQLVKRGEAWGAHVNEPWNILVAAGLYLIISVGLNLPIFGLLGDAVVAIIRACGADLGEGMLAFTPRSPHIMYQQNVGWTLAGLALQIIDAIWYVYLTKTFTKAARIIYNRPLDARQGKRSIVIVDTPAVHQLLENFVSKLYAQSYGPNSVDVHGASGLDHFVHRFTHRVARGTLIAVGRPDGRLCCLAKSEAAVLLAAKQAAFIRNADYVFDGNGPEIVTVGHNPFMPSMGLAHAITLSNGKGQVKAARRKFVDEYLYDRLFLTNKPFTTSILRSLRSGIRNKTVARRDSLQLTNKFRTNLPALVVNTIQSMSISNHSKHRGPRLEMLPYGAHHIDPSILTKSDKLESSVFSDFVVLAMDLLKNKAAEGKLDRLKSRSFDPAMRQAFAQKLDSQTKQIQNLQVVVQQFYECRIASLERYLAFCVMFHAMASSSCKPAFKLPWDIAKSQSNLRVATTASPISAGPAANHQVSQEVKKIAHNLGQHLRKFGANF